MKSVCNGEQACFYFFCPFQRYDIVFLLFAINNSEQISLAFLASFFVRC